MGKSPKNSPNTGDLELTPRRWALILAASVALHVGGIFIEPISESVKSAVGSAMLWLSKPSDAEIKTFKEKLADVIKLLKDLASFEWPEFFLESDRMDGFIESDDLLQALIQKFKEKIARYEAMKSDFSIKEMITKVIDESYNFVSGQARVSGLLQGNGGNCEAFTKYMITVLYKLYPEMELKVLVEKGDDGTPHMLPIAKIGEDWVRIEPGLRVIKDLT